MAQNPKDTIIDFLCTPLGEPDSPLIVASDTKPWKGVRRTSGGMSAIASTIQFLKERTLPRRQAHIVTFENAQGQQWEFTCFIVQEEQDNWMFKGGGGSVSRPIRRRDQPRANLAGGRAEGGFYAGGSIIINGLDIVRVCLITADGLVLEDTVDDGRVLFLTDKENVLPPVRAYLYDSAGKLVTSHVVFHT